MNELTRQRLSVVSTATLTTVLFKRGFRNAFLQELRAVGAAAANMVGPAFTLRYIPAREDLDGIEAFTDRRLERRPPADAAHEARRGGGRHGRRVSRHAGNLADAFLRLPPAGIGTD